jgi:IPT/TIG domain
VRWGCPPFSVVPGSMRQGCPDVYGISSFCCHAWPEEAKLPIPKPSPACLLTITLALGCLSCGVCVPRPSISGISPKSATAGSNSFLLSVDGSDFRGDSAVSWNGSFRVTSFVSSDRLVAAITAADIAQPGAVLVFVFNPPESDTTSVSGAIGVNTVTVCSGKDSNAVPFTVNP